MKKLSLLIAFFLLLSPFAVSAQQNLVQGGTGLSTYAAGDIPYATSNTLHFSKLNIGAVGTCLSSSGTLPQWTTCATGGNSKWATSTDGTSIYPNTATKVGIGTTTPINSLAIVGSNITPGGSSLINGNVSIATTDAGADNVGAMLSLGGDRAGGIGLGVFGGIRGVKEGSSAGNTAGALAFYTLQPAVAFAERARITSTGLFGINTTVPLARLSVGAGSLTDANVPIQISSQGVGTESYIGLNKNGAYGLLIGNAESTGGRNGGVIRQVSTDPLTIITNNTNNTMTFLSSGNVGIATTTPPSRLTLATSTAYTAAFPDFLIGPSGLVSATTSGTFIGANANQNFSGSFFDFQNNGTDKIRADFQGTLTSAGGMKIAQTRPSSGGGYSWTSDPTTGFWEFGAGKVGVDVSGNTLFSFENGREQFTSPELLGWNPGSNLNNAPDVGFSRNAIGTLALGNGTLNDITGDFIAGQLSLGTSTTQTATLAVQSNSTSLDIATFATTTGKAVSGLDAKGHSYTSGTAPVISSCGTGSPTISGDDQGGSVTTGTAATACTLTFNLAYPVAPYCMASDNSGAVTPSVTTTTLGITFGLGAGLSGGVIYYECHYHR